MCKRFFSIVLSDVFSVVVMVGQKKTGTPILSSCLENVSLFDNGRVMIIYFCSSDRFKKRVARFVANKTYLDISPLIETISICLLSCDPTIPYSVIVVP